MQLSRRILLASSAATAAVTIPAAARAQENRHRPLRKDPFRLGVASGDPTPDGAVLWTRLAPEPLAEDGMGGMPNRDYTVRWEVAADDRFRRRVASGWDQARARWGHSLHIELTGLEPGREYFFRFKVGQWISPTGRTRTAPAADAMPEQFRMAFASCSQYEHGYFTAYRHLAESQPDLVLHLGDYQYEHRKDTYVAPGGNVRDHDGPETVTLANYRQRYAQYKSDPDLQAAHAAAPWLVVWDDHEVDNNWADEVPEEGADVPAGEAFLARREAAFQAFWENMPLRRSSIPNGIDMQIYRRIEWGRLARFHMMDTRQFRDDQACGDGFRQDCSAAWDEERSITGQAQEAWLLDGFQSSNARWDLLGQQVFFAQRDGDEGPGKYTSMDAWDGYVASRNRIVQGMLDHQVRNPVVLTGDVHRHWASEILADFDDPDSTPVGVELVTSSISSGGDGYDEVPENSSYLEINPHIKFRNTLRGFVQTTITPDQLEVDFQVVPTVSEQGAALYTRRSYSVADGEHRLNQTYDQPVPEAQILSESEEPRVDVEHADDRL